MHLTYIHTCIWYYGNVSQFFPPLCFLGFPHNNFTKNGPRVTAFVITIHLIDFKPIFQKATSSRSLKTCYRDLWLWNVSCYPCLHWVFPLTTVKCQYNNIYIQMYMNFFLSLKCPFLQIRKKRWPHGFKKKVNVHSYIGRVYIVSMHTILFIII